MDRKGILFIPLSYNADSIKNIINVVFSNQYCSEKKLPYVDKISFLRTIEFNSDMIYGGKTITINDFYQKIKEEVGSDCVEIRERVVFNYAQDIPNVIMDGVKEVGKNNIIIDLTCGKKDITGSLYMAASIVQITNMIYVEVFRNNAGFPILNRNYYEDMKNNFNMIRYESLKEIENIASLNGMDFIYYKKNIQEIRQAIKSLKMELFCNHLEHVVDEYFSGSEDNYRNAIRTLGLINEEVLNSIKTELLLFYKELKIKETDSRKSLNLVASLEKIYQNKDTPSSQKKILAPFFSSVPIAYEIFETIRIYRNIASHNFGYNYKREEVKLLIDMVMLVFNGLIENGMASKIWGDEIIE